MIAVLVDEYEDAVDYVTMPNHGEPVFVVCRLAQEVPPVVNAIVYLGGSEEVRSAALAALMA
jgi:hypothetical protein